MKGYVPASEEQLIAACNAALRLAPTKYPPDLPISEKLLGASEWYSFEQDAWSIGESVRRAFTQHPQLKRKPSLLFKVLEVATCRNLRRGRQSFIMALGFVAARPLAPEIAEFVADPDVDGQVIYTLLKMRVAGYTEAVAPLLQSNKTWIRQLAGKYVERYG
jgi:hypothetical protein